MSFVRSTSSNIQASTLRPPRSSRSSYQEGAGKLVATGKAQTPERASVAPALLQRTGRGVRTKSDGVARSALEDRRSGKEGIEAEAILVLEGREREEVGRLTPEEAVQKVQQLIDDWDPEKPPECSTFHIKTDDVDKLCEELEGTRARLHVEEIEEHPQISEVTIKLAGIVHDSGAGGLETMLRKALNGHLEDKDFGPKTTACQALLKRVASPLCDFEEGAKKGRMAPDGQLRPKNRDNALPGAQVWESSLTQSEREAILKIDRWMQHPAVLSAFHLDVKGKGDDRVAILSFYRKPLEARWGGQVKAGEPEVLSTMENKLEELAQARKNLYSAQYTALGLGDNVILPVWRFSWKQKEWQEKFEELEDKWDLNLTDCFIHPDELEYIKTRMRTQAALIKEEMPKQVKEKVDDDDQDWIPITSGLFHEFSEEVFSKKEWKYDDADTVNKRKQMEEVTTRQRNDLAKKKRVASSQAREKKLGDRVWKV
ncbi:hypothetical protein PQX77_020855 [Marasmius sp. AFHP31]|nr:hypothetical protein PQX77_020855 [Marasmius sp. AFHP31]